MRFLVFVIMITAVISSLFSIYMHEQVHKEIYKGYGIESEIEYFNLEHPFEAVTYPEERCPTNECILANDINEAIGYHLEPFYLLIGVGLIIIIMFQYFQYKQLENLTERCQE